MPDGPTIILTLKILVSTVTVLFAASLIALARGNTKLHGRINTVFFILTLATVLGFEGLLRVGADVTSQFSADTMRALRNSPDVLDSRGDPVADPICSGN